MEQKYYTHHLRYTETEPIPCQWHGCSSQGKHPAPRSPHALRDYLWFCPEHIKLYNKSWDFFAHMPGEQVRAYQESAIHQHRPTWKAATNSEYKAHLEQLYNTLHEFLDDRHPHESLSPSLPFAEREALSALELRMPVSKKDIKKQYKILVKECHPDLNSTKKDAAERFKRITEAYRLLLQSEVIE